MSSDAPADLLMPADMPPIPGLLMPYAFYWVLRHPALSGNTGAVFANPVDSDRETGFAHVVCLTDAHPDYDPSPLNILHAVELEDLVFGDHQAGLIGRKRAYGPQRKQHSMH